MEARVMPPTIRGRSFPGALGSPSEVPHRGQLLVVGVCEAVSGGDVAYVPADLLAGDGLDLAAGLLEFRLQRVELLGRGAGELVQTGEVGGPVGFQGFAQPVGAGSPIVQEHVW